jgi:hypothetical protein
MKKETKYFDGASGVYYDTQKEFNDLIVIEEVEPYSIIDKNTFKVTKIKRYNIQTENYNYKKTALSYSKHLIYIGEL